MPDNSEPTIMWFREDLRLADNPALFEAAGSNTPVIPLFILDDESPTLRKPGAASRWWLHQSLESLSEAIAERGNRLCLRSGETIATIEAIAAETGAGKIVWNRRYGNAERDLDARLKERLGQQGIATESYNGKLLNEPWTITNKSGRPFRIFTPFWKACLARMQVDKPLPAPERLPAGRGSWRSERLDDWDLQPTTPDWAAGFRACWQPGEAGAAMQLDAFVADRLGAYADSRDFPALPGTSRLSAHLAFGEVSPRQIWWAVHSPEIDEDNGNIAKFVSEIGWREFAYHILFHNPDLARENLQSRFDDFSWAAPDDKFIAWKRGRTGYPIIDAAMRQLWQTGWMHNRCRMLVGSFLTKHLLTDWRHGENWFWDTLVDADPANNPAGWQWIAGTGADAAPYFRVFNPILQSRKFDPDGAYIRAFCPELAKLDDNQIHEPWAAPERELKAAGIQLGHNYPRPVVDHKSARDRALKTYSRLTAAASE